MTPTWAYPGFHCCVCVCMCGEGWWHCKRILPYLGEGAEDNDVMQKLVTKYGTV